jgi:hypothetical protein
MGKITIRQPQDGVNLRGGSALKIGPNACIYSSATAEILPTSLPGFKEELWRTLA